MRSRGCGASPKLRIGNSPVALRCIVQVLRLRASQVDSPFLAYLSDEIAKLREEGAKAEPLLRFLLAVRERVVAEVRLPRRDQTVRAPSSTVTCCALQLQDATRLDAEFISALLG